MGKLSYALRGAAHMDYKELFRVVGAVHRETGRARPAVLADIASCAVRYGAGFNDYLLCAFYDLTDEQRATYVTRGVNNRLVAMLNDQSYSHFFDNKSEFYRRFSDFLGREWIDFAHASPEAFRTFLQGKEEIIVKPEDGTGGHGVEKYRVSDFPDTDALYARLRKDGVGVAEEVLRQHPDLDGLYPGSINTLRIVTILNEQGAHVVYAHIRIGNSDKPVDNLHSGGMFAPIDPATGTILYVAYDKARRTFERHPKTGVEIPGFQIPFWEESVALCLKGAQVVPEMRYIGWDVCVTPEGPVFVEGNNFPGYDILQMPPHTPDKIGMIPRFWEFVDI